MAKIHHANLILNAEDAVGSVFEILKNDLDFSPDQNPDFYCINQESFGISEARDFGRWVDLKPFVGDKKVCLIVTKNINIEAQNALLKSLEEPPIGTYIFISVAGINNLLPTFISRVRLIDFFYTDKDNDKNASKFLNSQINERLSQIQSLAKKENKNLMKDLINDLEKVAFRLPVDNKKQILTAKIFALNRGSSPRVLLEWLACML